MNHQRTQREIDAGKRYVDSAPSPETKAARADWIRQLADRNPDAIGRRAVIHICPAMFAEEESPNPGLLRTTADAIEATGATTAFIVHRPNPGDDKARRDRAIPRMLDVCEAAGIETAVVIVGRISEDELNAMNNTLQDMRKRGAAK